MSYFICLLGFHCGQLAAWLDMTYEVERTIKPQSSIHLYCGHLVINASFTCFQALVYALGRVRRINKEKAEAVFKQGVRRTKEECKRAREEIIRSSSNIDEEDRIRYKNKILRCAAAFLKQTENSY